MNSFLHRPVTRAILLALAALLALTPVPAPATGMETEETPEYTAQRLQQTYDQITSLTFHFTQTTQGELSGRAQQGSGTAWFVKAKKGQETAHTTGKMRWDYTSPEQQTLVSDGVNFSMYFAKLQQMIVSPAETMRSDITYSFFTGSGNLIKDFIISAPAPDMAAKDSGETRIIRLTPREAQSQVNEIHLWVTPASLIQRIDILDHFDTRTTLELSNLEINTLPPTDTKAMDALFRFTPPEGTEIINQ